MLNRMCGVRVWEKADACGACRCLPCGFSVNAMSVWMGPCAARGVFASLVLALPPWPMHAGLVGRPRDIASAIALAVAVLWRSRG